MLYVQMIGVVICSRGERVRDRGREEETKRGKSGVMLGSLCVHSMDWEVNGWRGFSNEGSTMGETTRGVIGMKVMF